MQARWWWPTAPGAARTMLPRPASLRRPKSRRWPRQPPWRPTPATTETRVGAKQQLLAACRAAEHWLQAELDRPGETRPDDILCVLRAAIARAEGQRKPREQSQAGQPRQSTQRPRESTKEALVIDMLRRPEGATIAQIMAATGWQAHTVRGVFAGALKKKRGLTVTSDKAEGSERVYRMV